jgi:signal transduction histidine kinase/ligand-binding sensor domain-containing protein/DNA-binding response OmpR family regulator
MMLFTPPTSYLDCYRPGIRVKQNFLVFTFLILAFLIKVFPLTGQEKPLRFQKYGVENGLPNEQINDILEDNFGFIWLATFDGLYKFDGFNFKGYHHIPGDHTSLPSSMVNKLMLDSKGDIWVVTEKELSVYHRASDNFEQILLEGPGSRGNAVQAVFEDKNRIIWVGMARGLYRLNQDKSPMQVANPDGLTKEISVRSLMQDPKGRIWVCGNRGLHQLDTNDNCLKTGFPLLEGGDPFDEHQYIYNAKEDRNGKLWLATAIGAKCWDPDRKVFLPTLLPDSLARYSINDVVIDHRNNVWLAFQYKGLIFIDQANFTVRHFQRSPFLPDGLVSDRLYKLLIDGKNNLWIGSLLGFQRLRLTESNFPVYQIIPGMDANENEIGRIHADRKGGLWLTTINGQMYHARTLGIKPRRILYPYPPSDRNIIYYYSDAALNVFGVHQNSGICAFDEASGAWKRLNFGDTINTRKNTVLFKDNQDPEIFWIGNETGLCKLNWRTNRRRWYYPHNDIPTVTNFLYNMVQLPDGNLLVNAGEFSTGTLALFDQNTGRFKSLYFEEDDPFQPAIISIRNFTFTGNDRVWMATPVGLIYFDIKTGKHRTLTTEDGFPSNNAGAVLADEKDNIWVAYDGYISKFIPSRDSVINFDVRAEMPGFYTGSCSKGPDGRLYFGGSAGLMAFLPDSVKVETTPPKVVLTDFTVFNETRNFGTSPELINSITLPYKDEMFSLHFTALDFDESKNIRYKYKLEGFNDDWGKPVSERSATYTHLDPGDYTFQVIANKNNGLWPEQGLTIEITIEPPWWRTWLAYFLYIVMILGGLYAIYRFLIDRKLEHAENIRLKELDTFKTRLYTNITHEFRTPLTVIAGMADQIREDPGRWLSEGTQIIKRNTSQLLRLVNQMLDLRKLETGRMLLNMVQDDILIYLKYLVESFHSQAAAKNIRLHFETDLMEMVMDYDPDKLQQIVSNLLFNALKFTPEEGEVELKLTTDETPPPNILIQVSDTGIGIPPEKQPYVFDRFYQADDSHTRSGEGTGIGLALTRELVKLLKGEISVKSEPGHGSVFEVKLPVRHEAKVSSLTHEALQSIAEAKDQSLPVLLETTPMVEKPGHPQLLLIEDNPDVVRYLAAVLQGSYHLTTAQNGREGIEKAIKTIPDLVISDVMMPEKDGFEVCETLKNDERTSHIPVILLTAKADMESRLEGLTCGADAYLAKPFNKNELLIRIQKLLELRQHLQQHFLSLVTGQQEAEQTSLSAFEKKENEFIEKVKEIIIGHIGDSQFSVESLSREVAMSRSQLHRKVTALTGVSPNRFVRYLKLQKARDLLIETDENITNIAYDTGFNDPGYFTRVFTQEFGMAPSEFREAQKTRT